MVRPQISMNVTQSCLPVRQRPKKYELYRLLVIVEFIVNLAKSFENIDVYTLVHAMPFAREILVNDKEYS